MKNNKIKIICTSDVHGKIFPHSYADGSKLELGFGRLKTCIDSIRDENTILIDNGDVLVGSALQLYHMMNYPPETGKLSPVTKAICAMDYDFINLGNHDFDYGTEALMSHIRGTGAKCITKNVLYSSQEEGKGVAISQFSEGKKNYRSLEGGGYEIVEILGKKIAIFGVVTHFVPRWESPEHLSGLEFLDALETTKKTIKEIKSHGEADYIILVYHGGFEYNPETQEPIGADNGENQGYKMLKEIPEIDFLFTGHQHLSLSGDKYLQPGESGGLLSLIEIDVETDEIKPSLVKVDTEEDESLLAVVRGDEEACQIWLDKVIGEAKQDMLIRDGFDERLHKTQLITYLNKVQMEYSGADISGVALFYGALGLGPEITVRQIVSTYVFPDSLVVKRINGKTLREYLEKDMEFWTIENGEIAVNPKYLVPYPQHFNYDMLDGIEYTAKISNDIGERIICLTKNGIPITDDMEFTIVLSNYRAAGGGNYFMISEEETVWQDSTSILDILIKDITEKKIIDFESVNNIEIIK